MWRRRTLSSTADVPLSWGELLHEASVILAGVVIMLAIINILYQASIGQPMIPVAPFIVAGAIWLVGLFCRFVSRE
jgi:hypothetical protein